MTLTGTAAAIETALASATYTGGANYYGPDTLTVATTDTDSRPRLESDVGWRSRLVDTTTVYGNLGAVRAVNENTASLALSNYVTVTDTPNTTDDAVDGSDGYARHDHGRRAHTGASVTLTGTAAAIETALASATYTGGANYYGPDTLTVATTDTGDHASFSTSAAITVNHVAPIIAVGAYTPPTFTGGGSMVTLDSVLTVTDVDSGDNLTAATVKIQLRLPSPATRSTSPTKTTSPVATIQAPAC